MARIRTIKPDYWTDSKIMRLSLAARLVFIASWNFADDVGVLEDDILQLRAQVAPGGDIDVKAAVDELCRAGRFRRAVSPDGTSVLVIPRFLEHQRINRPSAPKWGDPKAFTYTAEPSLTPASLTEPRSVDKPGDKPLTSGFTEPHTRVTEHSSRKGREGKGYPPAPRADDEPDEPPDEPGGTATPQPQARTAAARVLDRVTAGAPTAIAERLRADLNGQHHRLVAQAIAAGWHPAALVDRIGGRWDGVHHPGKALIGRIRGLGPAPPKGPPPLSWTPSYEDDGHTETPDVGARHAAEIREQLEQEDDP